MDEVSFDTTAEEMEIITEIVERAEKLLSVEDATIDTLELSMDITAIHCNGCSLRLFDLLNINDFNFLHDVTGINRHIDRDTGQLEGHFYPRFAA